MKAVSSRASNICREEFGVFFLFHGRYKKNLIDFSLVNEIARTQYLDARGCWFIVIVCLICWTNLWSSVVAVQWMELRSEGRWCWTKYLVGQIYQNWGKLTSSNFNCLQLTIQFGNVKIINNFPLKILFTGLYLKNLTWTDYAPSNYLVSINHCSTSDNIKINITKIKCQPYCVIFTAEMILWTYQIWQIAEGCVNIPNNYHNHIKCYIL